MCIRDSYIPDELLRGVLGEDSWRLLQQKIDLVQQHSYAQRPVISAVITNAFQLYSETPVSYTHLRAHETVLDLVCRLLLEKKNTKAQYHLFPHVTTYETDNNHTV